MALSTGHRNLLLGQAIGSVVCNFPLNGALAWYTFPPVPSLPLWARANCVAFDTIGTSFFLPLITCLIVTAVVRRLIRRSGVPGLSRDDLPRFLRVWPRSSPGRGAIVGLVCALTIGLVTPAVLGALGFEAMTRGEVALYKAIFTSALGIVVTPLFAWRALADVTK